MGMEENASISFLDETVVVFLPYPNVVSCASLQ